MIAFADIIIVLHLVLLFRPYMFIGFNILCFYGHLFLVLAFLHRCCHMLPGAPCGYFSLPLLTAYMEILFENNMIDTR